MTEYTNLTDSMSEKDKIRAKYALSCILHEGSKLLLFLLFFSSLDKTAEYLYAITILCPLRIASGGIHFKHYISCFAFSFGYLCAVILGLSAITPSLVVVAAALLTCVCVNVITAPAFSSARPTLDAASITRSKHQTLVFSLYAFSITLLFYQTSLAMIGFWVVVLHALQLVIAKLFKKGEHVCLEKS